jgi:hypothetical protein
VSCAGKGPIAADINRKYWRAFRDEAEWLKEGLATLEPIFSRFGYPIASLGVERSRMHAPSGDVSMDVSSGTGTGAGAGGASSRMEPGAGAVSLGVERSRLPASSRDLSVDVSMDVSLGPKIDAADAANLSVAHANASGPRQLLAGPAMPRIEGGIVACVNGAENGHDTGGGKRVGQAAGVPPKRHRVADNGDSRPISGAGRLDAMGNGSHADHATATAADTSGPTVPAYAAAALGAAALSPARAVAVATTAVFATCGAAAPASLPAKTLAPAKTPPSGPPIVPAPTPARTLPRRPLIVTLGTRGDVQPFLPLCRAMAASGWAPLLCSLPVFANLAAEAGVPFAPLVKDEGAAPPPVDDSNEVGLTKTPLSMRLSPHNTNDAHKGTWFAPLVKDEGAAPPPVDDANEVRLTTAALRGLLSHDTLMTHTRGCAYSVKWRRYARHALFSRHSLRRPDDIRRCQPSPLPPPHSPSSTGVWLISTRPTATICSTRSLLCLLPTPQT